MPDRQRVEITPPAIAAETANVLRVAALIVIAVGIYIANTANVSNSADRAADAARGPAETSQAAGAGRDLMPYQRLFSSLSDADQRMFRELQEGLLEAENIRGRPAAGRGGGGAPAGPGDWPLPAALAAQLVPPFADSPAAARDRRYGWRQLRSGLYVGYLGEALSSAAPSFLVVVQEPDPQAPADPAAPPPGAPNDEVHHRLADGTVLHVGIWMLPASPPASRPGAPLAGVASVAGAAGVAGVAAVGGVADPAAPGASGAAPDALLAAPYARGWVQLLAGAPR